MSRQEKQPEENLTLLSFLQSDANASRSGRTNKTSIRPNQANIYWNDSSIYRINPNIQGIKYSTQSFLLTVLLRSLACLFPFFIILTIIYAQDFMIALISQIIYLGIVMCILRIRKLRLRYEFSKRNRLGESNYRYSFFQVD